ncbi:MULTISPECIES: flagellar hook-associated protein FlgK [unclassified Methylobacterium]|jgi:flagellar hook-associated protein 1|uniref:flagellar hook-associated protein FlgK n=1 Tax=unclassified Methylobacterium TaxID=2615210 RepID=UPI001352214C|nr:flagellar hook-associated protein FlgK [Methylobacterium sp. 2A]MWV25091.1 flagellar hook-associated protein FlgK [Methylobacterium sp. 2A]
MSLSVALNTARGSLSANGLQTDTVSRNVAGVGDASYSRKVASLVTTDGPVRVVVNRVSNTALFDKMINSTSDLAGRQAILDGLKSLEQTVGDTEADGSMAAKVGTLDQALSNAANQPNDQNLAKAAVAAAKDLARTLNQASTTVQSARKNADDEINNSVQTINDLLTQFDKANKAVMTGTVTGTDISDALDNRDKILAKLSQELGITTVVRANNDMAIYADNGSPLFDKIARPVTFQPTSAFAPGTAGNAVFIDGVQVTGSKSLMPLQTGRIVGQMTVRDEVAVTYQNQLDALAGGVISALAETNKNDPTKPALAGLLTYAGGPPLPANTVGLAASIRVNAKADPEQGGDPFTLRDGGMNGTDYQYNTTGAAAFSDHLRALQTTLRADQSFPTSSELPNPASVMTAAQASASWLEAARKAASAQVDTESAVLSRTSTALSNATGVNRDDEVATMLQLEKSYAASAKLIATVNAMLQSLLDAVR